MKKSMKIKKMVYIMDKHEKIGYIWLIAGFFGIIGLGFRNELETWESISLLIFTIIAFGSALYFVMHDYGKKEKSVDE